MDTRIIVSLGLVCFAAFLALFVSSWGVLEYTELGLDYSSITKVVSPTTYRAGRYWLGIGHYFLKFPATVQTVEFATTRKLNAPGGEDIRSRTKDGLEVQLEISFQYKIEPNNITRLFQTYGFMYEPIIVRMAVDELTTAATLYNASTFFTNRTEIGSEMAASIDRLLSAQAFVTVPFFQLRTVKLPTKFEDAIQDTEVKKQEIQIAKANQSRTRVEYQTKILQAEREVQVISNQAEAIAKQIELDNTAYIQQYKITQLAQAESFAQLLKTFDGNAETLLEYMKIRAIRDHPASGVTINIPNKLDV
eukprot:CAMPEP_0204276318 /NCGR_PEP_ID=MMETSP0468-20130131/27827_1 /ASSEMBLY_ACC=CAM_ASM_000383 /TAXON_ID=2969 /ORGANISM="Oxyrrhis marina" /LENGTH=305 /DNA_ID=CAMNT_0051252897 /DNA_START=24 /DNA_END=941 /DNA_ORIENTATION=-